MCRAAKGHNFINIFMEFSQNIIIPTHYIEFQEPSLNTFQDILLTRFNSDFFQRGITLNKYARQEKDMGQLFFHWEPKYKISKP